MSFLRIYGAPSTSYYYFGWRLARITRRRRELSGITKRRILRKAEDPMDIPESEFKNRYRLTKHAFWFLCEELRRQTNLAASKRISLELKVLCALSFYATGSYQRIVGMSTHLGQTSVSRYVQEVTAALNEPNMADKFIKFPTSRVEREAIKQKFFTKFNIPGVCGCIDASHFHIHAPKKEVEHLFYCRKHFYSINVQIICDSDCHILNVNPKYGGATHDAFIWENSAANKYLQQLHRNHEQVWLLADSGYPQRPWLMTPIPGAIEGSAEARYSFVHAKARVAIENTFGRLKNRWRCLNKDRTLHYQPSKCAKIIVACCVLHNLALRFGIDDPEDLTAEESVEDDPPLGENEHLEGDLIRGRALRAQLVTRFSVN